jgi:hypothetical protein
VTPAATDVTPQVGVNTGDGQVVLSYTEAAVAACPIVAASRTAG